ncbi:alpha/beta fold hydrolase [Geodermatophilus chilensis]|jgi:pimeloyl-ACP methyl ester carboxylesterase|uniref:alpha/beta fold hydrolase n=1 Tax=Geodermatophilus chilensis TaxID=2035835 RepID=UPI000C25A8E5|nr:alpha/beta fold hydrolase [Geodermatophilus chilensis]
MTGRPTTTEAEIARIDVDGRAVEYLDTGPPVGPALVLLHGDGETARDWRWVAPALADAGHRVIAPSLPGHGGSVPPASYAMEDLAVWLARFLDAVGIAAATVGGNSIGGLIAIHLALGQPSRVQRLLLVDSAGLGQTVNPLLAAETLPGAGEAAIGMTLFPGGPQLRAFTRAGNLFAQPWRVPAGWWSDQFRWGGNPVLLDASVACKRAIMNGTGQHHVVLDRLGELNVPTLVLWGLLDTIVPVVHGRSAARRLSDGRLEVLPGCGHVPHVESPKAFLAPVLRFLEQTKAAAR